MVTFELRQPIETREPRIEVDPGLPPGTYRFALTVTDEAGNESRRDVQTVQIRRGGGGDRGPIGPVIRGPDNRGPTVPNPNRRSSIRRRR